MGHGKGVNLSEITLCLLYHYARTGNRHRWRPPGGSWSGGSRRPPTAVDAARRLARQWAIMANSRVGIWLIGAKGGVASTAILGLAALKRGLVGPVGLVSQLPQFGQLGLADWDRFVVAGHEIRRAALVDEAMRMARESRHPALPGIVEQCRAELEEIDARIRPGTILGVGKTIAALADWELPQGETPRQAVARLGRDMAEFVRAEELSHLVVVNVASTEPAVDASESAANVGGTGAAAW